MYKLDNLSEDRETKLLKIGMNFKPKFTIKSWDESYLLAKKYYSHYGNLEIPSKFKTKNGIDHDKDGFGLGSWIEIQRKKYMDNELSEEQKEKLLKIKMRTEYIASDGSEMYALAEKYYKHYKNLEVPEGFKTKNGIDYDKDGFKLGKWVARQREKYKNDKMSDKRYQQLLKIGMRFDPVFNDNIWNEMYALAEKYYKHYKNLDVPFNFKTKNGIDYNEEGVNLGHWISDQRVKNKKQKLSSDRVQKLSKIGMKFDSIIDKMDWNEWYTYAVKYYQHYGHLKIVQTFKTKNGIDYDEDGVNLGSWIMSQRSRYNQDKLSAERIELLEIISMVWNITKNDDKITELCLKYNIDYKKNKKILKHISIQEMYSKILFLENNNVSLINESGILHEIFSMSSINMELKYGISLENIIKQYYFTSSKEKGV